MDYKVCHSWWKIYKRRVVGVVCSQGIIKSSHEVLKVLTIQSK